MLKFYRATVYFCPPGTDIEKSIPLRSGPVRTMAEADAILDSLCQQRLPCAESSTAATSTNLPAAAKSLPPIQAGLPQPTPKRQPQPARREVRRALSRRNERTTTTKPDAYAVRRAVQPIVIEYLAAKACAQVMREEIDERQRPLLESAQIVDDNGAAILTAERLYRAADGQEAKIEAFYEACKVANVAAGWKGDREHCPALCADTAMVRLENRLLDIGFAAMGDPQLTHLSVWGDKRKKAIDLFCGLALAKR